MLNWIARKNRTEKKRWSKRDNMVNGNLVISNEVRYNFPWQGLSRISIQMKVNISKSKRNREITNTFVSARQKNVLSNWWLCYIRISGQIMNKANLAKIMSFPKIMKAKKKICTPDKINVRPWNRVLITFQQSISSRFVCNELVIEFKYF